jgi:DNA primase
MKQEILSKINIYDYIAQFVHLQQKGKDQYLGLCPFHNEKTPSFSVSIEKKFFHCFGCKASGDLIKFVMLYDNVDYDQAMQKLANEVGIKITAKTGEFTEHKLSLEINSRFSDICNEILKDKSSHYGLDYLRKRELKDEMIDRYHLGYLPSNRSEEVFNRLRGEFSRDAIFKSGLFKLGISDKPYCQFNGRIIFPISDINNKVVGFGSRVILNENKPKYLNSADSDFFHKSELLYALNKIYGDKQLKAIQTIFVVEGYMDVISLANHGITNCVGVLGANLTTNQLKKLWSFTDRPTVCFDSDSAGTTAMERIAKLAVKVIEPGKSIGFLELNDCKDPDEFVRKYGPNQFLQHFKTNRISLADYLYKVESNGLSLRDPDEIVVLRQRLAKIADEIANDVLRNEYKRHFNKVFFNKQTFKNDFKTPQYLGYDVKALKITPQSDSVEEQICQMIAKNSFLLMDQEILDDFMNCKFRSDIAEKMRMELTKNIDYKYIADKDVNIERQVKSLVLSLKIRDLQEEIMTLNNTDMNQNIESQFLQLKKYEIQLKDKLSSILI